MAPGDTCEFCGQTWDPDTISPRAIELTLLASTLPPRHAIGAARCAPSTSTRSPGLLRHVLSRSESGMVLGDLARAAYQTTTSTSELTRDQARGVRELLIGHQASGWVACDQNDVWRATVPDAASERVQRERAEAAAVRDKLVDQVERERASCRRCAAMLWAATRRAAVEEVHARYRAWWAGLGVAARAERARAASIRFRDLPPLEQAKAKHEWVTRRALAGVDEAARRAAWLASLTPAEYTQRCQDRQDWFRKQPGAVKGELVRMWQAHLERLVSYVPSPTSITRPSSTSTEFSKCLARPSRHHPVARLGLAADGKRARTTSSRPCGSSRRCSAPKRSQPEYSAE